MSDLADDRHPESVAIAQRIIGRLHRIPEPAMRAAALCERLVALPPEGAVQVMAALVDLMRPGDLASSLAMHAMTDLLGNDARLGYNLRADWYREARKQERQTLLRMFLPRRSLLEAPKVHAASDPIAQYFDRPVPLGEKRSLARGKDRNILERLLLDPHPLVIRNLLRNPHLTEEWVLRICTRRPIRDEVLLEIARSDRWFHRYRVRLALARNPYTPTDLAVRCVLELQTPDLRDMAQDLTLHEAVVESSREELARRQPLPSGGVRVGRRRRRRSAAAIRGRPVTEGFGPVGADLDLVLAGDRLLEVADPLSERVAKLGDPPRAEDDQDEDQDQDQLGATEADGQGEIVHGATVAPRASEDQKQGEEEGRKEPPERGPRQGDEKE